MHETVIVLLFWAMILAPCVVAQLTRVNQDTEDAA